MSKNNDIDIVLSEKALVTFAKRIKELRSERDFSMERLAGYIGLSRSAISMYETQRRKPDVSVIMRYSNFFGVSSDYLLGKTNIRKPLYSVACFSNLSDSDIGRLSKDAQNDIKNFIADVMARENAKDKK